VFDVAKKQKRYPEEFKRGAVRLMGIYRKGARRHLAAARWYIRQTRRFGPDLLLPPRILA
jgi:hypothetical protein